MSSSRQTALVMTLPLVVILAGGEGRRIGGGKAVRSLGGEPLIERAIRAGRLWSDDVRLSLRTPEQISNINLPILIDDPDIAGPLAGLWAALLAARDAQRHLALTIACDVPFLPADLDQRLLAGIGEELAAVATSGPNLHPTCALWRVEANDQLATYASSGHRSLIGFAEQVGCTRVQCSEAELFNVNSLADLAEAERKLASEIPPLISPPASTRF